MNDLRGNKPIAPGTRFARLTAIRRVSTLPGEPHTILCRCDCGRTKQVLRASLTQGLTRSCGCLKSDPISSGTRFARLTIVRAERDGGRSYVCRCSCRKLVTVLACHLRSGHVQSCGCWYRESRHLNSLKHGHNRRTGKSPEYCAYHWQRQSCRTKTSRAYPRHGGRGIQFLFDNFQEFLAAVGPRPGPGYRLARFDRDGDFAADNLRWIPPGRRNRYRRTR